MMAFRSLSFLALASLACAASKAFQEGEDLAYYISRPELRAPLLSVKQHDPDAISPGYLFMAPYAMLDEVPLGKEYVAFQAGPHIYDNDGELVWSGAELVENRNTYDFRLTTVDGVSALTYILDRERSASDQPEGAGVILNTSYQQMYRVNITKEGDRVIDMHEFNVINGRTSLSATEVIVDINVVSKIAAVLNTGFREIDIHTGKILFEWAPLPQVPPSESLIAPPRNWGTGGANWDCYHLNSVDKSPDGESYIVSMRYTSTIYKISARDGSIIWRLGGHFSNFVQNFIFSSQHDAKFVTVNETVTIISFLDNASDEQNRQPATAPTSAIKLVALYENETPLRAVLLQKWDRPDGGLTKLRGQAQLLPNGGAFAGWSEQGYVSEFAPDGHTVLEAKYVGNRFNSYRMYKYNFVGQPVEPPRLKTHAYRGNVGGSSKVKSENAAVEKQSHQMGTGVGAGLYSLFAVSWNGATEVDEWVFYGATNATSLADAERKVGVGFVEVGSAKKTGFETTFVDDTFWPYTYVQAKGKDGNILGASDVQEIILPRGWKTGGRHGNGTIVVGGLEKGNVEEEEEEEEKTRGVSALGIMLVGVLVSASVSLVLVVAGGKGGSSWRERSREGDAEMETGEMRALKYKFSGEDGSEDDFDEEELRAAFAWDGDGVVYEKAGLLSKRRGSLSTGVDMKIRPRPDDMQKEESGTEDESSTSKADWKNPGKGHLKHRRGMSSLGQSPGQSPS